MAAASRDIAYRDGEVALTGVLAWDDAAGAAQPGILMVHGGTGLVGHTRGQASRYAALGYTVFACDMFGDGVAGDRERVMAALTALRADPDLMAQRGRAGLATLLAQPEADGCIAAVGFCFGGLAVLTFARSGLDIPGVISMHGALSTVRRAAPGSMSSRRVLACHGALDPHVPMGDVTDFVAEMAEAGADWQVVVYGSAMHGFTHSETAPGTFPGVEYHEPTDRRSFAAAREFLGELRARPTSVPARG